MKSEKIFILPTLTLTIKDMSIVYIDGLSNHVITPDFTLKRMTFVVGYSAGERKRLMHAVHIFVLDKLTTGVVTEFVKHNLKYFYKESTLIPYP